MPRAKKRARKDVSEEEESDYISAGESSEEEALNSDALDEDTPPPSAKKKKTKGKTARASKYWKGKKEQEESVDKATSTKKKSSPVKSSTSSHKRRKSGDSPPSSSSEPEDGFITVGRICEAPKTGRVPPGQISQNTFDFLKELQDPKKNDREWFKLHEPVYRQAEKEWNDFVEEFTSILSEVDDEIPHLPPKDVIHRIYRDVRFSNDKTPYKRNFSASFSRTGRKGIFSHYHLSIKPGGGSIFAAGVWCPGKNELQQIRTHIRHNAQPLRDVISNPTFESLFGPAKWSNTKRQNIFGGEDQLKVAPKGVPKDHPDIDLLKCRSFAVVHHLTDEQVLAPDFKELLGVIAEAAKPFVHRLNHMLTVGVDAEDAES